jgi:hypothetical protein
MITHAYARLGDGKSADQSCFACDDSIERNFVVFCDIMNIMLRENGLSGRLDPYVHGHVVEIVGSKCDIF